MKEVAVRRGFAVEVALVVCLIAACAVLHAQAPAVSPVTVGSPMPDFTLPAYQGGTVSLSALKGKTIVLIFPRGYSAPGAWCHVCNYQYSELADYDAKTQFRKKANTEILFVLPYAKEAIADWVDKYPQQLADLEVGKNPPDPSKLDDAGRLRMERYRKYFPKAFKAEKGAVPLPFPVLVDADRAVSKGLGIFTTEWSGSKVDQDVPTVFVIDPVGVVQFKYFSQNTVDRPGVEHIAKVVDWVRAQGRPSR
jgi:peroxiredoxin